MALLGETENKKITFGGDKRWFCIKNGNLIIEYVFSKKIYIIRRTDGRPFDGATENVGAEFYGDFKVPETLDEIIEYEVNLLAGMQIEPEAALYNEFDWAYNEDKTKIIISPIFLEKCTNITIPLPQSFRGTTELSFGTAKRIRTKDIRR